MKLEKLNFITNAKNVKNSILNIAFCLFHEKGKTKGKIFYIITAWKMVNCYPIKNSPSNLPHSCGHVPKLSPSQLQKSVITSKKLTLMKSDCHFRKQFSLSLSVCLTPPLSINKPNVDKSQKSALIFQNEAVKIQMGNYNVCLTY